MTGVAVETSARPGLRFRTTYFLCRFRVWLRTHELAPAGLTLVWIQLGASTTATHRLSYSKENAAGLSGPSSQWRKVSRNNIVEIGSQSQSISTTWPQSGNPCARNGRSAQRNGKSSRQSDLRPHGWQVRDFRALGHCRSRRVEALPGEKQSQAPSAARPHCRAAMLFKGVGSERSITGCVFRCALRSFTVAHMVSPASPAFSRSAARRSSSSRVW